MKKTKVNKMIAMGCLLAGVSLTSCEDWLTIYPNSQIVEENFWEDKNDLMSVRYAVYRNVTSCLDKYFVWGEIRADYYQTNPNKFDQAVTNLTKADLQATDDYTKWETFYNTINFCNKVLEHGEDIMAKDASFTTSDWLPIQAEMYAVRALTYFYLIRAFGDVPYVTQSINDDTQVTTHPAVSQMEILNRSINDMESTVQNSVNNYGNWTDNKAFMTRNAIYSLLADMYLWRAALKQGQGNTAEALADYAKCNDYCQLVIDKVKEQTEEYNKDYNVIIIGGGAGTSGGSTEDDAYPFLIQTPIRSMSSSITSVGAFNRIFGSGNSTESIFELQCDASSNKNTISATYLYGVEARLQAAPKLKDVASKLDDATVSGSNIFYKTDLRKLETTDCSTTNTNLYYIWKYACSSINHSEDDIKDNTNKTKLSFSVSGSVSRNWIVYRVTDVMLMKAEALTQMGEEHIGEAFALVEAIYKRSNPYPYSTANTTDRLASGNFASKDNMEKLILHERQREFVAEGKRWFDLVRFALRRATPEQATPTAFMDELCRNMDATNANILRKKLVSMKSLYLPINETELKANPQLVQNPVWNKNQDISKN